MLIFDIVISFAMYIFMPFNHSGYNMLKQRKSEGVIR